jgi:secondary thiamine-phosphate synthase enzyme
MSQSHPWLLSPNDPSGFVRAEIVDQVTAGSSIHHTEYLYFQTERRYALINITELVEQVLARSGVQDGFCYVGAMHITAGVYINDAEGGLLHDIAEWIERLAPYGRPYLHHETGEDNADAHLKSFLTNHSAQLPVTRGRIDFGTYQQIFYAEFDGMREKRVLVKITGLAETT